jgi:hypothetical protein
MVSQAQYWKVEEYEPVNSHLWVEMSPLPTRFNRQIADDVEDSFAEDIRKRTHMYGVRWELGERAARTSISNDLQQARIKTATGNLTNTLLVRHMNEGRHAWNVKGVDPDDHHAGGVLVVVRGREILLHGEGEQFKCLRADYLTQ